MDRTDLAARRGKSSGNQTTAEAQAAVHLAATLVQLVGVGARAPPDDVVSDERSAAGPYRCAAPERPREVEWAVRRPDPALHALITRYIGYRQQGVTLDVHRGLPSRHMTLIISIEEPIRLLDGPGSDQGPATLQAFVGGLHTGRALIAQDRVQAGVHLELNPLGVRTMLGISASELAGRMINLGDLNRPGFATLPGRLRAAPGWAARFRILDEVLLASARVIRFGQAAELLRRQPFGRLAEVAQRCGYADQAHLTNEWRSMAGCTPRTWLVEEFPFLQDAEVESGPT